jgi:hypothetical protein
MNPPASQLTHVRELVQAYGSTGLSWWCWQSAGCRALRGLTRPLPLLSDVLPLAAPPPVLRVGARGDVVRWAQRWLRVRATGRFTSGTARAVRRLQAADGLAVTGVIDAPTWAAITARATSRF